MPITPFHFGPAAAAKAISPKYFSFLVFGFSQLIIDAEPAFYIARGDWPVHRFLHTYLGASLVAVIAVAVGRPVAGMVIRVWNQHLHPFWRPWLEISPRIPLVAALSGALFGTYSHVLLDSVMWSDIRPFAPWFDRNILLGLMPVAHLYMLSGGLGVLGGLTLLMLGRRRAAANRKGQGA